MGGAPLRGMISAALLIGSLACAAPAAAGASNGSGPFAFAEGDGASTDAHGTDPSGTVVTERDGLPIAGATVRLLRSSSAGGPFAYVPNGSAIMTGANKDNPDTTGDDGAFGWDVTPGYYVVHASKAGCGPASGNQPGTYPGSYPGSYPGENPATTPVLQVPPPATNLVIRLDCGGPKARATTAALTFPLTAVGALSAAQTFDVFNDGAERLHLTLPLTTSGASAADFTVASTCPSALAPGAACTVTVRFAPLAPTGGTRSARIVLGGDGDGPTPSVTLNGSTPPPVAPPPPPPPPPAVKPVFASGCVKSVTRVSRTRHVKFTCRLSVVDGARFVRVSRARLGATRFRAVQGATARLVAGRVTVRLRLSAADVRRVRRAGRRGVRMLVRAQALSGARKPLVRITKRTRLRR